MLKTSWDFILKITLNYCVFVSKIRFISKFGYLLRFLSMREKMDAMTKNFEQEFVTEQEFHSRFFVPVQLIFSFECLLSRLSMFRRKLSDLFCRKMWPTLCGLEWPVGSGYSLHTFALWLSVKILQISDRICENLPREVTQKCTKILYLIKNGLHSSIFPVAPLSLTVKGD